MYTMTRFTGWSFDFASNALPWHFAGIPNIFPCSVRLPCFRQMASATIDGSISFLNDFNIPMTTKHNLFLWIVD
jgi:hypothetical protein